MPAKVEIGQLNAAGHGPQWGLAAGNPVLQMPLIDGQMMTVPTLAPAAYVGLSRAQMGELIDSLTRTHSNLIALADMCAKQQRAYEAEASGINATIQKLNGYLR